MHRKAIKLIKHNMYLVTGFWGKNGNSKRIKKKKEKSAVQKTIISNRRFYLHNSFSLTKFVIM